MAKLVIDMSGRGGLVQNSGQAARNSYIAEPSQILNGTWNPFIRRGYLSPANGTATAVTLDNALNAAPRARIYDAVNNDFYIAEAANQLFRGDGVSDTSLTRVISLAAGSGIITDLEIYTVNGAQKLFVMYKDNAGTAEIAISNLPYDTATDNETWTATVAGDSISANTVDSDFFMVTADNGFAYLFMKNQVHRVDGTAATGGANGTMKANILLFPTSFNIVDAIDKGGYLYIALHQYSFDTRQVNPSSTVDGPVSCGVYIWDRQTTVIGIASYVPIPGVSEISKIFVGQNGSIRVLAKTTIGHTEIYELSGSVFKSIQRVGFDAYPVFQDAVDTFGNMTAWLGHNGVVYAYGSAFPGDPEGLFQLYSASVASTTGGLLMSVKGSSGTAPALYLGYQSSVPALTLSRLSVPTLTGQAVNTNMSAATITYPVSFIPPMSVINSIDIYCVPTTGTAATSVGTVKIYFNQATTQWATKTVTQALASRGYVDFNVAKPYINSIQLEVDYPATTALGTNDFAPAYAVVDYTPATDKP